MAGRTRPQTVFLASMLALLCACQGALAQENAERTHCRPDEVDMGDYCASLPPPRNREESSTRRVTPFRAESMMPGRTRAGETASRAGRDQAEPAPVRGAEPGQARHSFGVQLGVYSDKVVAMNVARPLLDHGLPVSLARMERENRILWACIHGPFPDEETAAAAAERLSIDLRIRDTYIKSLDELELTELTYDPTEK